MRHNKFIGWERFLNVVEQVQKYSPWLSRQIANRASEWPFWYSGLQIRDWGERHAWVQMPLSFRNTCDGQVSHGHLLLGAELSMRLVLLRLRQEFPFKYRIMASTAELTNAVDQSVDFKFGLDLEDWERVRLTLARESRTTQTFYVQVPLSDGRLAAQVSFELAFELEKFLPA